MHILHITAWYPNKRRHQEALFIERHIKALESKCENTVWHVECRKDTQSGFLREGHANRTLVYNTTSSSSLFCELFSTCLVLWLWFTRNRAVKFDVINFNVAYPNLVYYKILKYFIKAPFVITDHFSAYHYAFHSNSKGVDRARKIFHHNIPVITVSESLAADIRTFANLPAIPYRVVPNVVDTSVFNLNQVVKQAEHTIFCVAGWKTPKRPDVLFDAFVELAQQDPTLMLRVGGDGPLLDPLKERASALPFANQIHFLGRLAPEQVALEMRKATLFAHPSNYETFSVVCAEALCCGTPVVASNVGGIPDFVNASNGSLVQENELSSWVSSLRSVLNNPSFNGVAMAKEATQKFSSEQVGELLYQAIKDAVNNGFKQ